MTWAPFAAALALFYATHALPTRPVMRARLRGSLGPRGFTLAYSALSLFMLALVIHAAGQAPWVQLWPQMEWMRHLTLLGMLAACLLVALAIGRPNPFSFGGPSGGFDPARPGIVRVTRHPLLWAMALWAGLHLMVNGDVAHAVLFGGFALFAVAGTWAIDRRRARQGPGWQVTLDAMRAHPPRPADWRAAILRIAGGVALWLMLIAAHPALIGVSPLP
ncbi:NnrU family protein [Jannaschia aquimarina]|uniref:NnrU family protein n=1 Tax=Jannaschia aquimarina TaxID=935700 RepID=UPI000B7038E9|nr:NnrU family protein [Jannaschia aquimarina]SNT43544.1 Uncharacterized membrane protein [Jannaschia aquimarina]